MEQLQNMSCDCLKGVGPTVRAKLEHLTIYSVYDLLLHLPLKYEDRTRLTPMRGLRIGQMVLIQGKILSLDTLKGRRTQLICHLSDGHGQVFIRFFHFAHTQGLAINNELRCFGEVRYGPYGFEMVHPDYTIIRSGVDAPLEKALSPVYPTTNGLGQRFWRKVLAQSLALLNQSPSTELLPADLLQQEKLWTFHDAVNHIHQPPVNADQEALCSEYHPARRRLIFEELLAHQLSLRYVRETIQSQQAKAFTESSFLTEQFKKTLPFSMTSAQHRVSQEILNDLAKPQPMLRLVQGDVGSGKTIVAAFSALHVIGGGGQIAMMVPTEILAEQHYQNFVRWFATFNLSVGILHGKVRASERRALLQRLQKGEIHFIVGTHALFQEEVIFKNLALVVIDEQHRFGVHQRMALRDKGIEGLFYPHQLIMTATPIPRTLAMCAYADLDYSIIDEMPPGRKPVKTVVIDNQRRPDVVERISTVCALGNQVYWVCTLIEESEVLQAQTALQTVETLARMLPALRIALIHGRLSQKEKESIMLDFKRGKIDVLVATTVIEVGVDVPNANLMIIENAERLGLSQLHQLRGRVGRGSEESHCVLLYQSPLSKMAKQRLKTMRESHDGFFIAEQDLALRGPGEFLGVRQTGGMQMRIADLIRDAHWLPKIQQVAISLMKNHPEAAKTIHARWLSGVQKYSQV